MRLSIPLLDGKYTFVKDGDDYKVRVLRYHEPWLEIESGSNAVVALMARCSKLDEELDEELDGVRKLSALVAAWRAVAEAKSWPVMESHLKRAEALQEAAEALEGKYVCCEHCADPHPSGSHLMRCSQCGEDDA